MSPESQYPGEKNLNCSCAPPLANATPMAVDAIANAPRGCGCPVPTRTQTPLAVSVETASPKCQCQKYLWIRRLHALAGLAFGCFLVEHLFATALGVWPGLLGSYLQRLHGLLSWVPWLEGLVFLPLPLLLVLGTILLYRVGLRYHVKGCKRGGPRRYFLQRLSATVLVAFLIFHLLTLARRSSVEAESPQLVLALSVAQLWSFCPAAPSFFPIRLAVCLFYLLGSLATVYHLTNGLWSGARIWGWLETPSAQTRWRYFCSSLGLATGILGILGWYNFTVNPLIQEASPEKKPVLAYRDPG